MSSTRLWIEGCGERRFRVSSPSRSRSASFARRFLWLRQWEWKEHSDHSGDLSAGEHGEYHHKWMELHLVMHEVWRVEIILQNSPASEK